MAHLEEVEFEHACLLANSAHQAADIMTVCGDDILMEEIGGNRSLGHDQR